MDDLNELAQLIAANGDDALWRLDEAWRAAQEQRLTDPRSAAERLARLAPLWARLYAAGGSMQWYPDQLAVLDAAVAELDHPGEAVAELQAAAHLAAVEWVTWVEGLSAVTLVNALHAADDFNLRFGGADQPPAVHKLWAQSRYVRALLLGAVESAQSKISALDALAAQLAGETDPELLELAQGCRAMATSEMLDLDPAEAERRLQAIIAADPALVQDEAVWAHRALLSRRWSALTPRDQAGRDAVLGQTRSVIGQALGGRRTVMRAAQLGGLWSLLLDDALRRADYAQLANLTAPYLDFADGAEPAVRQEILDTAIAWARGIDRAEGGRESEFALAAWAELGRRFANDSGPEMDPLISTVWVQWAQHENSHDREHAIALYREAIARFGNSTHPAIIDPITWTRLNFADHLRQLNRHDEAATVAEALVADISAESSPQQRNAAVIALRMLSTRLHPAGSPESVRYLTAMVTTFGDDPSADVREAMGEALLRVWVEGTDPAAAAWACEQYRTHFDADTDQRMIHFNNSRIDYEASALVAADRRDEAVALLGTIVQRWAASPDQAVVEDVRRARQRIDEITAGPAGTQYRELAAALEAAKSAVLSNHARRKVIKKARSATDPRVALLALRGHLQIVQDEVGDELWNFAERSCRAALSDVELLAPRIRPVAADELMRIHLALLSFAANAQEKLSSPEKALDLYQQVEQVAGPVLDPTSEIAQFVYNGQLARARLLVQLGNIPTALGTYAALIAAEERNQTSFGLHRIALAATEQSDLLAAGGDWRAAAIGYRNGYHAAARLVGEHYAPLTARAGVRAVDAWARAGDAAAAAAMADQLRAGGVPLDPQQLQTVTAVLAWARPQQ